MFHFKTPSLLKTIFPQSFQNNVTFRNRYNEDLENRVPFPFLFPQAVPDCPTKVINATSYEVCFTCIFNIFISITFMTHFSTH